MAFSGRQGAAFLPRRGFGRPEHRASSRGSNFYFGCVIAKTRANGSPRLAYQQQPIRRWHSEDLGRGPGPGAASSILSSQRAWGSSASAWRAHEAPHAGAPLPGRLPPGRTFHLGRGRQLADRASRLEVGDDPAVPEHLQVLLALPVELRVRPNTVRQLAVPWDQARASCATDARPRGRRVPRRRAPLIELLQATPASAADPHVLTMRQVLRALHLRGLLGMPSRRRAGLASMMSRVLPAPRTAMFGPVTGEGSAGDTIRMPIQLRHRDGPAEPGLGSPIALASARPWRQQAPWRRPAARDARRDARRLLRRRRCGDVELEEDEARPEQVVLAAIFDQSRPSTRPPQRVRAGDYAQRPGPWRDSTDAGSPAHRRQLREPGPATALAMATFLDPAQRGLGRHGLAHGTATTQLGTTCPGRKRAETYGWPGQRRVTAARRWSSRHSRGAGDSDPHRNRASGPRAPSGARGGQAATCPLGDVLRRGPGVGERSPRRDRERRWPRPSASTEDTHGLGL